MGSTFLRLVYLIILLATSACGLSDDGVGQITFSLRAADNVVYQGSSPYAKQAYDKTLVIGTVRVSAFSKGTLVATQDFDAAARQGELLSIPSGTYELRVEALAAGKVILRGTKAGIVVEPSKVADAGEVLLAPVSPRTPRFITAPPAVTSVAEYVLTAEKEMFTGILLNDEERLPANDAEKRFAVTLSLREGDNTYQLTSFNAEGTKSQPVTVRIELRTKGPVAESLVIAGGAQAVSTTTVTAQVSAPGATEMMIGTEAEFAGGEWIPYVERFSVILSGGDGRKPLFVKFRDDIGNESETLSASVRLDTVAPTNPSVEVVSSSGAVSTSTVTVKLVATGATEFQMRRSGESFGDVPWQQMTGAVTASIGPGDAWYGFYARFRDEVGNVTPEVSGLVILDTLGPTGVSVTLDGGLAVTSSTQATLDIAATDAFWMLVSFDPGFAGATWQTYASSSSIALPPGDGVKTVYVRLRDYLHNPKEAQASVVLDQTQPAPPAQPSLSATPVSNETVRISWSAVTDASGVATYTIEYSKDGGTYQLLGSNNGLYWDFSTAIEGAYTFRVRAGDMAGNESLNSAVSPMLVVDRTAPTGASVAVNGSPLAVSTASITLTLAAIEATEMQLSELPDFSDASWQAYSTSAPFLLLARDETKTIWARFRDSVDNRSAPVSTSVELDTTGPASPFVSINGGAAYVASNTVSLSFSVTGADEMRWDYASNFSVATWNPVTASTSFTFPAGDGPKTIYVEFRDFAGNVASASAGITVDTTPPDSPYVAVSGMPVAVSSSSVSLALSANGASEMLVSDNVTAGAWEAYAASKAWVLVNGEGPYTIDVVYRDAAGLESAMASTSVTLDYTPPSLLSYSVTGSPLAVGTTSIGLDINASDAWTSMEMLVSEDMNFAGANWQAYATPLAFSIGPIEGERIVYLRLRDEAGNIAGDFSTSVTYDVTAPLVATFAILGSPAAVSTATVMMDLAVTDATPVEMMLTEDGSFLSGTWVAYDPTAAFALSGGDGPKTIHGQFRDAAGNVSAPFSASTELDTAAPVVSTFGIPGAPVFVASTAISIASTVSDASLVDMQLSEDPGFAGAVWQPHSMSQAFILSAGDGTKFVFGRFRDQAGHLVDGYSAMVTLDTTAPSVPGVPSVVTTPTSSPVSISWTASTDSLSGVYAYHLEKSSDGGATWDFVGQTQATSYSAALSDGTYLLRVKASDWAGNFGAYSVPSSSLTVVSPTIVALSISSGPYGSGVTISGTGFGAVQGVGSVKFGAAPASVISWSDTSVEVGVPNNVGPGLQPLVVLTDTGAVSNSMNFTVYPHIDTLDIPSGTGGATVNISGTNFGSISDFVYLDGVSIPVLSWSNLAISASIPNDLVADDYLLTVTAAAVSSNSMLFELSPGVVSSLPTNVVAGDQITLSGTNFGDTQPLGAGVYLDGVTMAIDAWSMTSIVYTVPASLFAGTKSGWIDINGNLGTTGFYPVVVPNITSLTPSIGTGGDMVSVSGTSFSNAAGTLNIGLTPVTPVNWANGGFDMAIPASIAAGIYGVGVTVNAVASLPATLTIHPGLTALSASTVPAGGPLSLTGTNFGATMGASNVMVGGMPANVVSWSSTMIDIDVPYGTTLGFVDVVVDVGGQPSSPLQVEVTEATEIVFISISQTISAGQCSAMAQIEFQDMYGIPAPPEFVQTVNLSATGLAFYSDAGCSLPIASVDVAPMTTFADFYFSGSVAGTDNITASAIGFTSANQGVTIQPGPSSAVVFTGGPSNVATGSCSSAISIEVQDAYGNPTTVGATTPVGLTTDSVTGAYYGDVTCTGTISSAALAAFTSSASFYYKDISEGTSTLSLSDAAGNFWDYSSTHVILVGVPSPTIDFISPTAATSGATVLLTGTNFGPGAAADRVFFAGVSAPVASWSDTSISVKPPAYAVPGSQPVEVLAAGKLSNQVVFEHQRPWIDDRFPSSGTVGTTITLTGRYFDTVTATIRIGAANAVTIDGWADTAVQFKVPPGTGKGTQPITITTVTGVVSNPAPYTQRGSDVWMPMDEEAPQARARHSGVWTGTEMIIWGGRAGRQLTSGSRYNPATDHWMPIADSPIAGRHSHVTVWSGREMIVWGGLDYAGLQSNEGARYDPSTDTWRVMTATGAPTAVERAAATWMGNTMVVTGGFTGTVYSNQASVYDPEADTWAPLGTAPSMLNGRADHAMVWTGKHLYVLGGYDGTYLAAVERWDDLTQMWVSETAFTTGRMTFIAVFDGVDTLIIHAGESAGPAYRSDLQYATINAGGAVGAWMTGSTAVSARSEAVGVWTGTDLLVFGGRNASALFQGGERWNKSTGLWSNMATANQPSLRYAASGVWTGSEMIVWGGFCALNACMVNSGGRYNPQFDSWAPTATVANPLQAREQTSVVWTGTEAIIWGGSYNDGTVQYLNTGGRYTPATDSWLPTQLINAPTGRQAHSAVWTGTYMVILVGSDAVALNTGGRYDPVLDSWTATPAGGGGPTGGPTARYYASAVWDPGTARVLLWGGTDGTNHFDDGKLYDPVGNAWAAMASSTGIVSARSQAATVWTGSKMLVWGGYDNTYLNTGGAYEPAIDTWAAIANGPAGRVQHTGVWTGTQLIVYGGYNGTNELADGAAYELATNTWSAPMATSPIPGRRYHTAVWTGSEMLVWGGYGLSTSHGYSDGAAYNPGANTWRVMSTSRYTPYGRGIHVGYWTGTEMFVFGGGHGAHLFSGGRYLP